MIELGKLGNKVDRLIDDAGVQAQRMERIEHTSADIKEALARLLPRLEDISGFIKHRAPELASKADLQLLGSDLTEQISKRPTRRQAIFDIAWIVGVIIAAVTFGSRIAH